MRGQNATFNTTRLGSRQQQQNTNRSKHEDLQKDSQASQLSWDAEEARSVDKASMASTSQAQLDVQQCMEQQQPHPNEEPGLYLARLQASQAAGGKTGASTASFTGTYTSDTSAATAAAAPSLEAPAAAGTSRGLRAHSAQQRQEQRERQGPNCKAGKGSARPSRLHSDGVSSSNSSSSSHNHILALRLPQRHLSWCSHGYLFRTRCRSNYSHSNYSNSSNTYSCLLWAVCRWPSELSTRTLSWRCRSM